MPETERSTNRAPSETAATENDPACSGRHPALDLDETVHQRVRLGILAILYSADFAEFSYLKRTLQLTDGNLDRHLVVLGNAGYVTASKSGPGRARTTVTMTQAGRRAFTAEMDRLNQLATCSQWDATT